MITMGLLLPLKSGRQPAVCADCAGPIIHYMSPTWSEIAGTVKLKKRHMGYTPKDNGKPHLCPKCWDVRFVAPQDRDAYARAMAYCAALPINLQGREGTS
jgi:hypothetical protein